MTKPLDSRLIAVVAQEQFEVSLNRFCKLLPIVYVDGERPVDGDFPNDNEVWWMLSAQSALLAENGRIVSCLVEEAREYNPHDLTKSMYQAQRESVRDLNAREDGLEVLATSADSMDSIQDLVSGGFRLECDHRPSQTSLLRWRDNVYGPLTVTADPTPVDGLFQVSFAPANSDMTIYQISERRFQEAASHACIAFSSEVSPSQQRRSECLNLRDVKHELLLAFGFERVLATHPEKLMLEPIDRKLVRFAKQCLTRKRRQDLRSLLEELELTGRETENAQDLVEAIGRLKTVTEKQETALDIVSRELLKSGLLGEDRLRRAEEQLAEKYVQERTAELQSKIELAVQAKREEGRQIEASLKELQLKLQKEENDGRARIREKLELESSKARKEIEAERGKLDAEKVEFQRQEKLLQQNLEKVTRELREAGDDVVNRFLAIAPLLGTTIPALPKRFTYEAAETVCEPVDKVHAELSLPAYITSAPSGSGEELADETFYDRFRGVVEGNGFTYRQFDLQRFHVSVKCGDLTVLGGPSGTGKSSLPALYSLALLGEGLEADRVSCLMVNINPSWMEIRDLIGHMNTLERRFYPAESGLFMHLLYCQEEYVARSDGTGIYLTCLDEMNLSQVEHYFSDFMMVLERRGGQRAIQCFSPETVGEHCPFRNWARINLAPSLRFVGTVNFDETTRLLSDRLLDRVNLIRLSSGSLPSMAASDSASLMRSEGRMVTLADFESWQNNSALPPDLGSLLDAIRPMLSTMGCPLSPRVYRAICRFVSSAVGIMALDNAFDAQLAQRVIPKIRNLVTRSQLDALDNLILALEGSSVGTFDESRMLLEEVRESSRSRGWDFGE